MLLGVPILGPRWTDPTASTGKCRALRYDDCRDGGCFRCALSVGNAWRTAREEEAQPRKQ